MKKPTSFLITCGLIASSLGLLFAGSGNADTSATSTARFSGTVATTCAMQEHYTSNGGTPIDYTTGAPPGPSGSGSYQRFEASDFALFDCNTVEVEITIQSTLSRPSPANNAINLNATHAGKVSFNGYPDKNLPNAVNTGGTDIFGVNDIDPGENGDISVKITSSWTAGEELLAGDYSATFVVTVAVP